MCNAGARQDLLPAAGEYTVEAMRPRLGRVLRAPPAAARRRGARLAGQPTARRAGRRCARQPCRAASRRLLHRLPGAARCSAALKLAQQEGAGARGGRHRLPRASPPSSRSRSGHSILGYGAGLASRAGVSPDDAAPHASPSWATAAFWHNGLLTGVQAALFNGDDAVLLDHEERLHHLGHRRRTSCPRPDGEGQRARRRTHPTSAWRTATRPSRARCAAWACSGCAWSPPTRWTMRRCARRGLHQPVQRSEGDRRRG